MQECPPPLSEQQRRVILVLEVVQIEEQGRQVPSESTFSQAFAESAAMDLGDQVHAARVKEYLKEEVVWHVPRDSTEIEAREKPTLKPKLEPEALLNLIA